MWSAFCLFAGIIILVLLLVLARQPAYELGIPTPSPVPKLSERLFYTEPTAVSRIISLVKQLGIQHVVVWGHPLHSHTHSYIHEAFYLATKHVGIDTHWIPVSFKDTTEIQYAGPQEHTLFITEGQVVKGLPSHESSWYLLHNVDEKPKLPKHRTISFQFYTPNFRQYTFPVFDAFHRISHDLSGAFMPWATNVLPHQFLPMLPDEERSQTIAIIGQQGPEYDVKIEKFSSSLPELKMDRVQHGCTQEQMMHSIQHSWCAPALINQWQKENGYIPCRIMKNISYGAVPVTTSTEAHEMLWENTICDQDERVLASKFKECKNPSKLFSKATRLVQTRHTYLNRLEFLLKCLQLQAEQANVRKFRPKVLHLTCHKGCDNYIHHVATKLDWNLQTIFMPNLTETGTSIYNMTAEKAHSLWLKLHPTIQAMDFILVSDTAPISRILLQRMDDFTGKVIVWVCNRFDYHDANGEAFPDSDWYALAQKYHERVQFISYTKVERMYALDKDIVWDNAFADTVIRPVACVDTKNKDQQPSSSLPIQIQQQRSDYIFVPPYLNDEALINYAVLNKHAIKYHRGRYNGPLDLLGFKAILHIPYAPSNLALFENMSIGLVYYIPSLKFMLTLMEKSNWFSGGNPQQNAKASEWYDKRLESLFVYFDSWEDLVSKLQNNKHLEKVEEVKNWCIREERDGLFQWNLLVN